jgi:colanic acid/amylovoran biosynthesis glycosyltransferase
MFLPVSQSLADRLVASGCERSKIVVLHSGIECGKFSYIQRRLYKGEQAKILTIGRLTEKKGIFYAIQAVARVIATGRNLSFTIIGEGPLRVELQRLSEELGVSESIKLIGWRTHSEVVGLIETAHVLLAPSVTGADGDEEGIPNSVKEAMATGMPVLSTSHGGIPELVEDGVSGYLVAERNTEAMADRLLYLIDHPQTWDAMGRAARTRVLEQFDTEKLNDELERLYAALIGKSLCAKTMDSSNAVGNIP